MSENKSTMLLTGNHAAAYGAMLARPKVIPIYPITPQTPISEKITELQLEGKLQAEVITPESEHSAMAASIPASLTGARVFTATSSQGLLFMHEVLHYASGARAPIVMVNVNRTIASPFGFWPDQTDSLAQRDTGWIQLYVESPQEALDTVIQAYKIAETVMLPTMVIYEAFYVSHSLEVVEVPAQETVDGFLPPYAPEIMIDPAIGRAWGNVVNQELYHRARKSMDETMEKVFAVAGEVGKEWGKLTGRSCSNLEKYRCDDAQTIIVAMGSMAGTAKVAVDKMRAAGKQVGLLKVRLFRPFPADELRQELEHKSHVIVLDRSFSPGTGGILHQEIKAALFGMNNPPQVAGSLAGVGGVNVSPKKIASIADESIKQKPVAKSIWGW